MKTFKQFITELKTVRYLHVGREVQPGEPLISLNKKIGRKAATQKYTDKWDFATPARRSEKFKEIRKEHPKYVHMYDPNSEDDTPWSVKHPENFKFKKGIKLYDIRPGRKMNKVETDKIEFPHPMVKDEIPSQYIRNVWDQKQGKWMPFNRKTK